MNQQNDSNCLTNPRVMITHNVLSHMMAQKKKPVEVNIAGLLATKLSLIFFLLVN